MTDVHNLGIVTFDQALSFSWPKIHSLKIENLNYHDEWVEGDIVLKYKFSGDHEFRKHIKTKLNEEENFDVGPLNAKLHAWLDGPKLWFGLTLCLGPLCAPEFKTSVDLPK